MATATDNAASSVEDATLSNDILRVTTSEMNNTSPRPTVAGEEIIQAFTIFICVFAFIANSTILISLIVYKQAARKTVNTFVCNQIALDATSVFFSGVLLSLYFSGYFFSKGKTGVLRELVCFLIDSEALRSSALYGSVYGLVVITVERYVKIVHPVAHRNRYRRWMTYVGVATPWLIGLVTSAVPSLPSLDDIRRCRYAVVDWLGHVGSAVTGVDTLQRWNLQNTG